MWKPPERIRHKTQPGRWPLKDEVEQATLFSPYASGRLEHKDRTWVPAMVPWRATEEGEVTDDVIDWYARFAQGRPGAIVVEATGIRDVPSGPLLRISHDRFIPGLNRLVDAVKSASRGHTKLYIQIIDFLRIRRKPKFDRFIDQYLVISDQIRTKLSADLNSDLDVRELLKTFDLETLKHILPDREFENMTRGARERVTDTHLSHIAALPDVLPDLFAKAALRAERAGFDGVELHYAHAYTMASFLSKRNTRKDGYGGVRENRIKLPLEVFQKVRQDVSDRFVVGCRMLAQECIEGGSDVEDAAYFATEFAKAGMDFISLSRGGKFEDAADPKVGRAIYPYTGRSGYECMPQIISDAIGPFERNRASTEFIRSHLQLNNLSVPVVIAGGIYGFEQAESLLKSNVADFMGFARQALADPDWFEKVRTGHGSDVRICTYTNYCEGLDQKHKMVTCHLWDRLQLDDPNIKRTPDGKRRTLAPPWHRNQC